MRLFIIVLVFGVCSRACGKLSTSVPELLLKCYRSNFTENSPSPPLTMRVFIELLRKLEMDEGNTLNMRVLSSAILHGLRFDGIRRTEMATETQFVTPYRASGSQFYKYKLLVEYLTAGQRILVPYDALTDFETCLLHRIISSTVDDRFRGDEHIRCSEASSSRESSLSSTIVSDCPIEEGIVATRKWGTVSPGHIVAAVASALEATDVSFQQVVDAMHREKGENSSVVYSSAAQMRSINNVWAATLAGDLGEVVVLQAMDDPILDVKGAWNDSLLQRNFYLEDRLYDMTRAEVLGGVDGLVLARKIRQWVSTLSRTRLSQVLEMYYSSRGVAFDDSYKACERKKLLNDILNTTTSLKEQTSDIAKLLQELGLATRFLYEEAIDTYSATVVQKFLKIYEDTLENYSDCGSVDGLSAPLDIIVIFDEAWDKYEINRLIALLAEEADVSRYGSKIGIIYGQDGLWIAPLSENVVDLFVSIKYTLRRANSLSLHQCLRTVTAYLQQKTYSDCKKVTKGPRGTVILVLGTSSLLTDNDVGHSSSSLLTIKGSHPEVRMVYVATEQNSARYETLAAPYTNDVVVKVTASNSVEDIIDQLSEKLHDIPGSILDFYCNQSRTTMEDYLTPGRTTLYEIDNEYTQRRNFFVQFRGNDYGKASVCVYDATSEDRTCKEIAESKQVNFTVRDYCRSSTCNVRFAVMANESKIRCTESDCRYPDQVRINIFTSWNSSPKSGRLPFFTILISTVLLAIIK